MKKAVALVLAFVLSFSCMLTSCQLLGKGDSIVIVYTNDSHCGIEDDIGFAGVAAYKAYLQKTEKYVTLVDCGDAVQGETIGTVTEGEALIRIMNAASYDICGLGNHEFDFGIDRLRELVEMADAEYVCCNIQYLGNGENKLGDIKPYTIRKYGSTKVAFVGVDTPTLISAVTPTYLMEDDAVVYDFYSGEDGTLLYNRVQETVDAAKKDGADYVILLSHCGVDDADAPYRSLDVIANTNGIDAVLDAHSHVELPCTYVENKDGEPVPLSSTGTKIANIGQLVISADGMISVGYIEDFAEKSEEVEQVIADEKAEFEGQVNEVVTVSNASLDIKDENGIRMIRSREMPLGDLFADALREYGDTDIAFINGGGIRSGIPEGEVTYADIIDVDPYLTNFYTIAEIDGQTLADLMEYFYKEVQSEYVKDGKAYGEFGSFQQVSGIRFTVDTSVESSVVTDENGDFISVGDTRRVQDIEILQDGEYVPLDVNKTYKVASHDYMLKNGGSGTLNVRDSFNIVESTSVPVCIVLRDYLENTLKGDLSAYKESAERIVIK